MYFNFGQKKLNVFILKFRPVRFAHEILLVQSWNDTCQLDTIFVQYK
jgi:hypothetical protein